MQKLSTVINSYSNSNINKLNNSNSYSTKQILEILDNLTDVVPKDGYGGYYVNQFRRLGKVRFLELVAKARAGSETPAKLFAWMLKNSEVVK